MQTAWCYVQSFVTIPACDRWTDRQTDGRTDGIAVANTALAMRALRRAVITVINKYLVCIKLHKAAGQDTISK